MDSFPNNTMNLDPLDIVMAILVSLFFIGLGETAIWVSQQPICPADTIEIQQSEQCFQYENNKVVDKVKTENQGTIYVIRISQIIYALQAIYFLKKN